MRDPKRIDAFLQGLGECWKQVPDWRFGQLICNVLGDMQGKGRDPFFPEEEEMLKFFRGYFGLESHADQ